MRTLIMALVLIGACCPKERIVRKGGGPVRERVVEVERPAVDHDGDGLLDPDDRCPRDVGPKALAGCPDPDGDGVATLDDRCPHEKGLPSEAGCMPAEVRAFEGEIQGITFNSNSTFIDASSYPVLDKAIAALSQHTTVKVEVQGHTDNEGAADWNLQLSQTRADAVRTYLVSHGIAAGRVTAVGYGHKHPKVSNADIAGRALNRRIEFVLSE